MPNLEDLACTSFPEAFQKQVRPEHQVGTPPLQQLIDLVGGQPVPLHQLTGQGADSEMPAGTRRDNSANSVGPRTLHWRRVSSSAVAEIMVWSFGVAAPRDLFSGRPTARRSTRRRPLAAPGEARTVVGEAGRIFLVTGMVAPATPCPIFPADQFKR